MLQLKQNTKMDAKLCSSHRAFARAYPWNTGIQIYPAQKQKAIYHQPNPQISGNSSHVFVFIQRTSNTLYITYSFIAACPRIE